MNLNNFLAAIIFAAAAVIFILTPSASTPVTMVLCTVLGVVATVAGFVVILTNRPRRRAVHRA